MRQEQMIRLIGLGAMVSLSFAACSPDSGTSDGTEPGSQQGCEGGKCDGVANLPELTTLTDLTTGVCVWTGQPNDTMKLECAMGSLVEGTTHQHVETFVVVSGDFSGSKSRAFRDTEIDGMFREVVTISREDFAREPVRTSLFVGLGGENGNTSSFSYQYEVDVPEFLEDGQQQSFDIDLPFDLRPVSFWPTPEIIEKVDMTTGTDLFYLNLDLDTDLASLGAPFNFDGGINGPRTKLFGSVFIDGVREPRAMAGKVYYVPAFDEMDPLNVQVILGIDLQPKQDLTEPGYYVVNPDGSLTLTAPTDLPDIGPIPAPAPALDMGVTPDSDMGASQDDMADGSMDMGSPTPDMPPVDPCMDTCTAGQVCVAGECVERSMQRQNNCSDTPTKTCDLGEDLDCAEGNVCVEGLCRRLICQSQGNCTDTPQDVCEVDTHCADGNVCVEGLCRRLICQSQGNCTDTPVDPCERDGHCMEGNACVQGLCRRLVCQSQNSCTDTPQDVCEVDAHCADGNVCVEGLCRRLVCQSQGNCTDTPVDPCERDGHCLEGNVCVQGLCRRLVCQSQGNCTDTPVDPCENDDHCYEGNSCVNGVCARDVCM